MVIFHSISDVAMLVK